jgi:hypothetical protein
MVWSSSTAIQHSRKGTKEIVNVKQSYDDLAISRADIAWPGGPSISAACLSPCSLASGKLCQADTGVPVACEGSNRKVGL